MHEMEQNPSVDFLLIADRAEVVGGKLYLMGGAWEHITVVDASQPVSFSIALGINIPWNATNERHRMRLQVQDADGASLAELDGELVAGRPPHLSAGSPQRLLFATTFGIMVPHPGLFAIVVALNGVEARRTTFDVAVNAAGRPPG
ncbi:MAG TPA: hypothetical protein VM536_03270 [Chloroflexia bacterium]|nr:hypothetical protein [Chloroflexia bacterium]